MASTWDDLRRIARLLENEIEAKLISLNKISFTANGLLFFIVLINMIIKIIIILMI